MDPSLRDEVRQRAGNRCEYCLIHQDHFQWEKAVLVGRTPIGRATVELLGINLPDNVLLREALIDEGVFPPGT